MNSKLAKISGFSLLLMGACAVFAPVLVRHSYTAQDLQSVLSPPSREYWFGTDGLGRDLFARILFGARVSLSIGLITGLLSLFFGTFYGSVAGYFGGRTEIFLMRATDLFQALPSLVLMILISVIFNAFKIFEGSELFKDTFGMTLSLTLFGWVTVSRMVHGQVRQIKEFSFVEAARAAGASHFQIIFRHILPQLLGSLLVILTYLIPNQILNESFLSFIGLGLQPPYSSWGVLANEGWRSFRTYPHLILFPGFAIFTTMLASQFLGDGLRDRFDPKLTS